MHSFKSLLFVAPHSLASCSNFIAIMQQISGVTTNSGPPAKAAKHGHRAPLPAIEQFEVNCAASISTTMHSLQLCREKNGGLAQGPPDPRGPPCVAGSACRGSCYALQQIQHSDINTCMQDTLTQWCYTRLVRSEPHQNVTS